MGEIAHYGLGRRFPRMRPPPPPGRNNFQRRGNPLSEEYLLNYQKRGIAFPVTLELFENHKRFDRNWIPRFKGAIF